MAFGNKNDLRPIKNFPVPVEWIFEKFLNLSEKLLGQSVSINSVFNPNDTNPSLIVYYCSKHDCYMFKDFSSGYSGDAFELVKLLYDIDFITAVNKIQELYDADDSYILDKRTIVPITKEITNYKIRNWNLADKDYWTQYHIGSKQLEEHNIKPLLSYDLIVTRGNDVQVKTFQSVHSYGYFTKDGELYKIYNPKNSVGKFIKIKDYVQGHDQLKYEGQWLIILSSMKDLIAFKELQLPNIECIAPHSENSMLSEEQINYYKSKYKLVTVLFDKDVAGLNAAKKYKAVYDLHYTEGRVEKDIARCIKEHGIKNTKLWYIPGLLKTKDEARRKSN